MSIALPSSIPERLRRLLRRCLERDPKQRLRDIGDARIEISELLSGVTESVAITSTTPTGPLWRRAIAFAGVALAGAVLGGAGVWLAERSTVARPRVLRLVITAPGAAALSINNAYRHVAITPDGSRSCLHGHSAFSRASCSPGASIVSQSIDAHSSGRC